MRPGGPGARAPVSCAVGVLACFAVASALLAPGAPALAADGLTLKRVMLSTGGVGYYEYEASVTGNAALDLSVRLDRVDDVLKSIVVFDDRGTLGTISLPGQRPLAEIFRSLPFTAEALKSPAALLDALRGAEVRVQGPGDIRGRILAVTEERAQTAQDAGIITRHRLTLASPAGLRQVILEEAGSVAFVDPRLQEQIDGALAALARHGERDHRRLSITSQGEVARTLRVAYVAEAPLWKCAYRLTLDPGSGHGDPAAIAHLQGWAVVENLGGEPWERIELTVASGNPVTFRQALYDAYYVNRPQVPVEVLGRVLPGVDEGSRPVPPPVPAAASRTRALPMPMAMAEAAGGAAPKAAMALDARRRGADSVDDDDAFGESEESVVPSAARTAAAESQEAATQVLFRFPEPVSADAGSSLLLPVVDQRLAAQPVALYQPTVHARHPLAAVRLTNDTGTGLPPGLLTLYERGADGRVAFVGDARLGSLPAAEHRLLSFAVDQSIRIERSQEQTTPLTTVSAADGVLRLEAIERASTTYTLTSAGATSRTVLIEHPRRDDWHLTAPEEGGLEATPTAWRLPVVVPPGASVHLTVTAERPLYQQYSLGEIDGDRLLALVEGAVLGDAAQAALAELGALQAAVTAATRTLHQAEQEGTEIAREQDRLRKNLGAVPRESDLHRRYLDQLGALEDRLATLGRTRKEATAAVEAARQALRTALMALRL